MKKCQTSMQVMVVMVTVATHLRLHRLPIRIQIKDQVVVDKGEKSNLKEALLVLGIGFKFTLASFVLTRNLMYTEGYQIRGNFIDKIRQGDTKVVSLISPSLKGFITNNLKYFRLYTKENLEDIYQDTMEELIRKTNHPDIIEKPIPYVCSFAGNIIKRLLREANYRNISVQKLRSLNPAGIDEKELLSKEEFSDCCKSVKNIIKQLLPSSRELLLKYFFEEKTHKELRMELGYKNNEVLYTKLSKAKAELRKKIEASPNHKTLKEFITLLGYGHRE